MSPVLASALLGGALAVDSRSSIRLLVSQPVCGGLLAGLVLGDPRGGFLAGALLQTMFLGYVTLRGLRAPDLPLGGVAGAAVCVLARRGAGVAPSDGGLVLFLALLVGLAAALAGGAVYRLWEGRSYALTVRALRYIDEGRFRLAAALHLSTVALHFALGGAIVAVATALGAPFAAALAARAPETWSAALRPIGSLVSFIGVGSLIVLNSTRIRLSLFLAGFLVAYLVFFFSG